MTPQEKPLLDRYLKGITIRSIVTVVCFFCGSAYGLFEIYDKINVRIAVMETKQDLQYNQLKEAIDKMPKCECGRHEEPMYGIAGVQNNKLK